MRRVLFLMICIVFASSAFAERITMKSGKVFEGKVVRKTDEYVQPLAKVRYWGFRMEFSVEEDK